MIIAIDGPAASGKGTLARRLARRLDYAHLDTGGLYRAVGLALLRAGRDPADSAAAIRAAETLDRGLLDDPELRAEATGMAASKAAKIQGVRKALFDLQRDFALHPPGGKKGAILDGRDVGTVICPDADLKIFLTASPEVRADRRVKELEGRGACLGADDRAKILDEIIARDAQDMDRAAAPLKPAADAHLLDTSNLDIEAALAAALALVDQARDRVKSNRSSGQ